MINDWRSLFSEDIKDYEGYPIGKTLKYLADPEIISLAGGLPSPVTFQKSEYQFASQNALSNDIDSIMQYSAIPGEATIMSSIINYLKRDNIEINAENLLITTSGQHGLDLTGRLFLNHGDIVLMDRPTFAGAVVAFQMERPKFYGVDLHDDGSDVNRFKQILKDLRKEGRKPKFIYVVPDFQNPTGITMSLYKREALLNLSYEYNVPIVEDSPYRDLRYEGVAIPSIFSLDQQKGGGNVIGLYTFSKIFCPGMRVGFNIGSKEVIEKMTFIKEGNILNTPKYNQDMCKAFLDDMNYEQHISKCVKYYSGKLSNFLKTLESYFPEGSGVSWTKPEGGLFLWITLPEKINADKLFFEALKYKVAFVPGSQFYGENPRHNTMRVNFSYVSEDQLAEAVKRLAKCIFDQL